MSRKNPRHGSFPIKAIPNGTGLLSNTVTVDGDLTETKPVNNSRSATVTVK